MIPAQFITHQTERYSYIDSARMALDGGCRWIQLRMKDASEQEVTSTARELKQLCSAKEAFLIIDDHVEVAMRVKADGVHLGKRDMPVREARVIMGEEYIIGGTANTFNDVVSLARQGVDYIGCGPFRFTTTKKNLEPTLGLEGYRHIMAQMARLGIHLPVVAIGGIGYDDIESIMSTGVSGIALSGSILRASDPVAEMKRIITKRINNGARSKD